MESSVRQHLHSVTLRTLNAHSFNRASSNAAHALTDVFARYLELLATTAKQYAEHSGRDSAGVSVWDAMAALGELGVGLEELEDFLQGEAREMKGYGLTQSDDGRVEGEAEAETSAAARRLDSLADIKLAVSEGLETDFSDAVPLHFGRAPSPVSETPSSAPSTPATSPTINGIHPIVVNGFDPKGKGKQREVFGDDLQTGIDPNAMDLSTPPPIIPPLVLPLSPISNPAHSRPSSPDGRTHKRRRVSGWNPPDHVPDFLPPFPGALKDVQEPKEATALDVATQKPKDHAPPPPRRIPLPLRAAATSKSSYTQAVKYMQSSMASRFEELPDELPRPTSGPSRPNKSRGSLQPLIAAYHVIQIDTLPATNPARLRVANILADTAPTRYTAPDTIFSSSLPPPPRFPAPLPTHVVPLPSGDGPLPKGSDTVLPKTGSKVVSEGMRTVDDLSAPWFQSNLTAITRNVLPPHLYTKVTQLNPPPPLRASSSTIDPAQPLLYHKPAPAPWNSSSELDELKKKDLKKNLPREALAKKVPDAELYATWDWPEKDPEEPLVFRRGKVAAYSTASHTGGGTNANLFPPSPSTPALNGLRSPAMSNGSFAVPGLPASKSSPGLGGSIVLKGRKTSMTNGFHSSHP